jgi:HEPN domain-containing protein
MNEIDARIQYNVKEWISYAKGDLTFAQHGLTLEDEQSHRIVAYHAQQCVEKILKAYLVYQKVKFPYTHDISELMDLCEKTADWVEEIQDAKSLTLYASTLRYPGQDIKLTKEEAIHTVEIADHVFDVVRNALNEKGVELE